MLTANLTRIMRQIPQFRRLLVTGGFFFLAWFRCMAGEADINLPPLTDVRFPVFGGLSGYAILYMGLGVCVLGALYGLWQYAQTKAFPVHRSMSDVSNIIWETCTTYLQQQGKFLGILWVLIAACII